jgi:predicted protein tyrosine phosphatase
MNFPDRTACAVEAAYHSMMPRQPSIIIASRAEADSWSQHETLPIQAVISIVGIEDRPCLGFDRISARLRLDFEDVLPELGSQKFAPRAPTADHVAKIIEFAQAIHSLPGILLIHCTGGRSRSPAVALICLATWLGEGREADAVQEIFRMRPHCYPHRALVRFADEQLNRQGRLMHFLDALQPPLDPT